MSDQALGALLRERLAEHPEIDHVLLRRMHVRPPSEPPFDATELVVVLAESPTGRIPHRSDLLQLLAPALSLAAPHCSLGVPTRAGLAAAEADATVVYRRDR